MEHDSGDDTELAIKIDSESIKESDPPVAEQRNDG
jgi:hypothetical protein